MSQCRKAYERLGCNPIWYAVCSSRSTDQGPSTRCFAAGSRPATYNRAEPVRERLLGFHLVQVPGVPVDTFERNERLEDGILMVRQMANTVVVLDYNRLPHPKRGTNVFIHEQTLLL